MKLRQSIRRISGIVFGSFIVTLSSSMVFAQSIFPTAPQGVPQTPLRQMITQISSVILLLVGGVAVLFLIVGGFQYITASGNPDQVQRAKLTIMYSIIGIVICLLSYTIIYFVLQQLGAS